MRDAFSNYVSTGDCPVIVDTSEWSVKDDVMVRMTVEFLRLMFRVLAVFEVDVPGSGCFGVWVDVSIGSEAVSRFWVRLCNILHSSFSSFSMEIACSLREANGFLTPSGNGGKKMN
ncbi:hypothetical protein Tco_0410977 [Tanacetum coccineum]